ncbi:MAG: twin-arginine translocase TatA/TatE family subunit [bacterium]|nr:twin-arginine translocase TatA/TatE family subunit [bacterium]
MPNIGLPELLVIALVLVLLFGARKIPELMKGLGSGIKEFKKAANGDEDKPTTPPSSTTP